MLWLGFPSASSPRASSAAWARSHRTVPDPHPRLRPGLLQRRARHRRAVPDADRHARPEALAGPGDRRLRRGLLRRGGSSPPSACRKPAANNWNLSRRPRKPQHASHSRLAAALLAGSGLAGRCSPRPTWSRTATPASNCATSTTATSARAARATTPMNGRRASSCAWSPASAKANFGFGVDAIGLLGLKLDSGGGSGGTGLLPADGSAGVPGRLRQARPDRQGAGLQQPAQGRRAALQEPAGLGQRHPPAAGTVPRRAARRAGRSTA